MSNKSSDKKDNSQKQSTSSSAAPQVKQVKMREDTIPVIVVNGVYYPS